MKKTLEVILSPALIQQYEVKNKVAVVIDILRASTSICVAFQTGVKKILPVATPEECILFKDFGFVCAAERNAIKVEGFDLGNSPFEFQNPLLKDASIAFTTTNGTKAIRLAKEFGAAEIIVGSFLNLNTICEYLISSKLSAILLCAGWNDKVSYEDSLFAGAVVKNIKQHFLIDCDSAQIANQIYLDAENDILNSILKSSHARRFEKLNLLDDLKFCAQTDTMKIIPKLEGEYLIRMNN